MRLTIVAQLVPEERLEGVDRTPEMLVQKAQCFREVRPGERSQHIADHALVRTSPPGTPDAASQRVLPEVQDRKGEAMDSRVTPT